MKGVFPLHLEGEGEGDTRSLLSLFPALYGASGLISPVGERTEKHKDAGENNPPSFFGYAVSKNCHASGHHHQKRQRAGVIPSGKQFTRQRIKSGW